jgi:F-type H+-transporting ATPase subunit b
MHIGGWTIVFQTINFVILVWLLQRFLYRPVLQVIEQRQAESERILGEARESKKAAEALQRELATQREGLLAEQARSIEAARAAAQAERDAVLDSSRAEGARLLADARQQVTREREEALATLEDRAASLSVELAQRILMTATPSVLAPRLVDGVLSELRAMPANERDRLVVDSAPRLDVATAPALAEDAEHDLCHQLEAIIGRPLTITFVTDESLLAGIELRFSHATLRNTWRDSLAAARRALEHP